jgi:hypothetical protein
LSFYPGEKPSDDQMKEIAIRYLHQLGIINTQYAICKHTDKAHLHLHVVANLVNNKGKAISDSYIGLRGKKIAQQLTREYKLVPAMEKNLKLTHLESLSETEANRYKIYEAVSENLPHCKSLDELERSLQNQGIQIQYKYKGQTGERQGISFRIGNFCFKGSSIDRKFSYGYLQKGFGLLQGQKLTGERGGGTERKVTQLLSKREGRSHANPVKDLTKELGNISAKAMENLLRPEQSSESLPYELLNENRRKKKKQSHNRGRHL